MLNWRARTNLELDSNFVAILCNQITAIWGKWVSKKNEDSLARLTEKLAVWYLDHVANA